MSTVTLSIGPKSYTVACADGQEAHIKALGAMIAEKYAKLGSSRAPLEAQNLVFAALFLADELAEMRKQLGDSPAAAAAPEPAELDAAREAIARLEAELAAAQAVAKPSDSGAEAAPATPQFDPFAGAAAAGTSGEDFAARLETLAAAAEASAAALEAAAASA